MCSMNTAARPAEQETRNLHLLGVNVFRSLAMQRHAADDATCQQQKFDAESILQSCSAWHTAATVKHS